MVDISEEFTLLLQGGPRARANQLDTRPVDVILQGQPVRVAVDGQGHKHLLVPSGELEIEADVRSAGVALRSLTLDVGGTDVTFVDMACRQESLNLVFEHLADDATTRLAADGSQPIRTCQAVLDQWRSLLRTASSAISPDIVLGLVGELEVLRELITGHGPDALASWKGPAGAPHDFVHGGRALEVKCTSAVDPNFVHVNNLDQLDPSTADDLSLVVVHCKRDPRAPTLDDRMRELMELGVDKTSLLNLVGAAGYVFESDSDVPGYAVRGIRLWRVTEDFPGLRSCDLPEERRRGVSGVSYRLDLDVAAPPLADDAARELVRGWCA